MSAVNSTESSASLPPPPSRKPKGKSKTPTNTGTQQVEYGNSSNKPLRQEGVISSAPVAHPSETVDDSRRGSSSGNPERWRVGRLQGLGNVDELIHVNPDPIQLIDRTQNPDENSAGVWAKNVHIDDYSLIQGSSKAGAYVVWTVHIETMGPTSMRTYNNGGDSNNINSIARNGSSGTIGGGGGGVITIRKRYSEFDELRDQLRYAFPRRRNEIPDLPPKSVVSKFRAAFLESRRKGLEYFLLCILLNPVFAGSPIVKKFVRSG